METETKICPFCGNEILISAKKCKYCKEWVEEKEDKVFAGLYKKRWHINREIIQKAAIISGIVIVSAVILYIIFAFSFYFIGNRKIVSKNFENAITNYNRSINMMPFISRVYYKRGIAKYELTQYPAALDDIDKAISMGYDKNKVYLLRGKARHALEQYEGAIADYDKYIENDKTNAEAYSLRALSKGASGDINGAIHDYNDAIKINPNDSGIYYRRGITKIILLDKKGALADFTKAISLGINDAWVYYYRASIYSDSKKYKEALNDLNKALSIEVHNIMYLRRADVRSLMHDYKGAISDYDTFIQMAENDDKNLAEAYYFRGLAKCMLNRWEDALEDVKEASGLYYKNDQMEGYRKANKMRNEIETTIYWQNLSNYYY